MNSSETQTPAEAPAIAHEPSEASAPAQADTHAAAPAPAENAAAQASAPAAQNGESAEAHEDGEGAESEEAPAAGEGGAAAAEGGAPGEKKKRRRRRRKKHGAAGAAAGPSGAPGEANAAGAEGAAPVGEGAHPHADAKPGDGKKKDKKPKRDPHRERPAFNVGDVVFGKILEVGEDSILIDVAGKAKAVFDKLELTLPEDVADQADEDARKGEAEAEAILRGGEKSEGEAAAAEATADTSADDHAADANAEAALAATQEAPSEPALASESAGEAAAEPAENAAADATEATEAATDAAPAAEAAKPGVIQLPRVVLEAGATFVGVVHNDGGRGGMVVLTHHPKRAGKAKPAVAGAFKNKTEIFGLVTGVIKGGVEVDVDGLRAFAPGSHMALHLGGDLHHLVGKRLPFKVTQYAKRGRDVVLSRKAMLEVEARAARELALSKVKPGDRVEGTVRSVVPFGAFVDIGGVEGLVSLSEMSHNRSDTPSDVFKVGKKTDVVILKIDDKGKIWLSHKQTIPDPWGDVATKYAVGTKHAGKVVRLQPFGAFVELESGVDGLIHAADMFHTTGPNAGKRIEHPNEIVKVGDAIDVVVSSLETSTHKIALHPAPTGEAANEAPQRVQIHKMVKVVVVNPESAGLVVRVLGATGRHARGYITAAATGTPRGTEMRKLFPVGKELEAKVVEIDPRRGEVKLSIKAMQQDSERNAYQQYRQQVKREAKFGTFGDLLAQSQKKNK